MTDSFELFQQFREILCVCPCCGDLVRVSDLKLSAKGTVVKTWLDTYQSKLSKLQEKEENFSEKEAKLREKAVERGQQEAKKLINSCIYPAIRKLNISPFDIKPVLNPIDFVVFDGLNDEEEINRLLLLSKTSENKPLNELRKQVKAAVDEKRYDMQLARIDETGETAIELLAGLSSSQRTLGASSSEKD